MVLFSEVLEIQEMGPSWRKYISGGMPLRMSSYPDLFLALSFLPTLR
jgi:hypothetical protein